MCLNQANICFIGLLHELDDLLLFVGVNLSIDLLEYVVAIVNRLIGQASEVANKITDGDHLSIILQ